MNDPSRLAPETRRFTLPVDPVAARRFAYAADDENPILRWHLDVDYDGLAK